MALKCGLFVRLEAKPGKERAVKDFLVSGLDLTNQERARRSGSPCSSRRRRSACSTPLPAKKIAKHISLGNMAKALMSRVEEMLARPPSVEPVDVLAVKNQPA